MTDILPFGSNDAEATIDIGQQHFLGLTVVNFSVTSSWDSQGGQCTIELIQDEGEYLEEAVVGSPQYFEIVGDVPIFRFYGILKEVSRNVDANSKKYTAVLQSPTLLLEACGIVTDSYTGYGGAIEAYGPNAPLCIDFGHLNGSITPSRIFNIQNIFGMYENNSYGFAGSGFGKSYMTEDGIRADMFAAALHELVNGNPLYTPALGSNIIYGTDSYAGGNAYAYNFDINGFMSQVSSYIPSTFRVKSTNLLEFVNEICSLINFTYYVDLRKPSGAGSALFTGATHVSNLVPTATHTGTVYGGQICIVVQNMNLVVGSKFPLSAAIIVNEASDKLGGAGQTADLPLDMGVTGSQHPDGPPVASSPYGGEFPVEDITADNDTRYTNTHLSVRLNESAVGAKYVVGGFQSRINYVATAGTNNNKSPEIGGSTCSTPTPADTDMSADVYAYYGNINVSARIGADVPNIPVLSPLNNSVMRCVPIDVFDILGNLNIPGVGTDNFGNPIAGPIINGIYFASTAELGCALTNYDEWLSCVSKHTIAAINAYYSKIFSKDLFTFDIHGRLTAHGRSQLEFGHNVVNKYNTSASSTEKIETVNSFTSMFAAKTIFLRNLYDRVKYIADTHHGKTYAVKCPAFSIAMDADDLSPLNTYTNSWSLSEDAYLDPTNYSTYEAPASPGFISGGRLKSYCVYYEKTDTEFRYLPGKNTPVQYYVASQTLEYDSILGRVVIDTREMFDMPFDTTVQRLYVNPEYHKASATPNSNGYDPYELYHTINQYQRRIVCAPVEVSKSYVFLPQLYFTFSNVESYFPLNTEVYSEDLNLGNQAYMFANFLASNVIPFNGVGCIPFAIVTTKGNFFKIPKGKVPFDANSGNIDGTSYSHLDASDPPDEFKYIAIHPKAFGIAQQSTRYVYGPWITNTSLPYGCKIEYVKDDNLVPENYIIPSVVNIGGINTTISTGYAGMNTVGQLIADTVENFDFLFTEEGSVSINGYPIITHIGQSLVAGGPLVSDISINLNADSIITQYSMKTFAPKKDKANKFVIDQLSKIGRRASGR